MTSEQILDRMAQMIRVGFVNARQPEKMRVKVTLKDTVTSELVTDWLPVLCPRASQDMQYDLPDIGDQVLCLFLPYGLEQGFVIGSMYGKQTPPVQSGEKWHRRFSDGTYLEYDRQEHKLVANVQGNAELIASGTAMIKSEGPMTLEAPVIYARGKFVNTDKDGSPGKSVFSGGMEILNGGVAVPDADVVASGISLVDHVHTGVQPGPGTSSFPAGGGNSQGTETQKSLDDADSGNSAKHFELLKNNAHAIGTDTDNLIMCLPEIAETMAEKEGNASDKQGWLYLHDMFEKWLSGVANEDAFKNKTPFWIDINWALKYTRVNFAFEKLKSRPYLFSPNAREQLAIILKDDGKLSATEKKFFDYTNVNWTDYKRFYFQHTPVEGMLAFPPDGLMAAMGNFDLRALAKGYTEPEGNGHLIVISGISIFIWDSFNFKDNDNLGYWRCNPPEFHYDEHLGFTELYDGDFRNFRDHFCHGNDFLVLSKPISIDPPVVFSYATEL